MYNSLPHFDRYINKKPIVFLRLLSASESYIQISNTRPAHRSVVVLKSVAEIERASHGNSITH